MTRAALLFAAMALASCGYRFASGAGPLPQGITRVSAPIFVNHTAEPGLEVVFTRELREELLRSGVEAVREADAQLEGEVLSVWGGPTILTTPLSEGEQPTLASYRIHAVAKLRLRKAGQVLAETDVSGSEDYLPGVDILQSESNRQAALQRLARRLMRDGYDRIATPAL